MDGKRGAPAAVAEPDAARALSPEASTEPVPEAGAEPPTWPDEAAESAMVSELRARGEAPTASATARTEVEETSSGALPPLDDLVQKIPADVRETLEELFRARFVTVKRVPKKALKQA